MPLRRQRPVPGVELVALRVGQPAERSAHVLPHSDSLAAEQALERSLAGKPLDERAQLGEASRPLSRRAANDGGDVTRKRRGESGNRADGSGR